MSLFSSLFFWRSKPAQPACCPKSYSDGEFDIEGRDVFAVERTINDTTIIGWFAKDGDTGAHGAQEWFLPVSPAKHAELVARFRAKLAVRPVSSVAVESLPSIVPPEHSIAYQPQ